MRTELASLRQQFPGVFNQVNGKPFWYLDSAALAQVPQFVVDRIVQHEISVSAGASMRVLNAGIYKH